MAVPRNPVASPRALAGYPRLPGLDGLRGLSIFLVLHSHGSFHPSFPRIPGWPFDGSPGVTVFLLLSGLLVTTQLLDERERRGSFSYRRYLARRVLRIAPALYVFLGVALLMRGLGLVQFTDAGWISAATYWRNLFNGHNDAYMSHIWTLSLQGQFYVLWPLVLLFTSSRAALVLAALGVAGWPLLRLLRHGSLAPTDAHLALESNGMDTLLLGCVMALLMREHWAVKPLARVGRSPLTLWGSLALLWTLHTTYASWPPATFPLLTQLGNLACVGLVWWAVSNPDTRVGRFLKWRPLVFLGAISYSLYIWQQPFLMMNGSWANVFPASLLLTFAMAIASYYLLEVPFSGQRRKLRSAEAAQAGNVRT